MSSRGAGAEHQRINFIVQGNTNMQSVAAYYVLVATELANDASANARHRYEAPQKPSRLASLVAVFTRPARRSAATAA